MRMFGGSIWVCLDVYALLSGFWVYKSFLRAAGPHLPVVVHTHPAVLSSPARGTAQLRRCLRQKQPKRSRGSGLLFASGPRPAQQKQGTATKDVER